MVQILNRSWSFSERQPPACPECLLPDKVIYKESFGRNHTQRYFCKRCEKSFSERTGKLLYRMRISEEDAVRVLTLYGLGSSPTGIQTKLGLNRRTVLRILDRAGANPDEVRLMLLERAGVGSVTAEWLSFVFEARVNPRPLPVDLNDGSKRRLGTEKALNRDGLAQTGFLAA